MPNMVVGVLTLAFMGIVFHLLQECRPTDTPPDTKSRMSRLKSILSFGRNHPIAALSTALGALAMAGLGQGAHRVWLVHLGFCVTYLILSIPLAWGILKLLRWGSNGADEEKAAVVAVILLCFLFIVIVIPFHWDKMSSLRGASAAVPSKPPASIPAVFPVSPTGKNITPIPIQIPVPRHKPRPKPTAAEPENQPGQPNEQPASNGDLQLLERAVSTVENCHSFQAASLVRLHEAQARIKWHNSLPGETEQANSSFQNWTIGNLRSDDMRLYDQIYKSEFMEVRKQLVFKVSNATQIPVDYESPLSMGGVTGICYDLSQLADAYLNRTYDAGEIDADAVKQYYQRIHVAK
jgi:hypothetical protein